MPLNNFQGPEGQEDMPYILTPGAVTTSRMVKFAMLADWGASELEFKRMLDDTKAMLVKLAGGDDTYTCVIVPGAISAAFEAVFSTCFSNRKKKTLIIDSGPMATTASESIAKLSWQAMLSPLANLDLSDKAIGQIYCCYIEMPQDGFAEVASGLNASKSANKVLVVDAQQALGSSNINVMRDQIDILIASSDQCLESVPGLGIVLIKRALLVEAANKNASISLDLHRLWVGQERGVFSAKHCVVALHQALIELEAEGGPEGRMMRYLKVSTAAREGLEALGLNCVVPNDLVQVFQVPENMPFDAVEFIRKMRAHGFHLIAQGRDIIVSVLGKIDPVVIGQLIEAVKVSLHQLAEES